MTQDDEATSLVRQFLTTSQALRSTLLARVGAPSLRAVVEWTWTGDLAEVDDFPEISYEVHGRIGCRLIAPSGRKVDFETTSDGSETFNAWRVEQFAKSSGLESGDLDALERACSEFAAAGALIEVKQGWFALPA